MKPRRVWKDAFRIELGREGNEGNLGTENPSSKSGGHYNNAYLFCSYIVLTSKGNITRYSSSELRTTGTAIV